MSTTFFQVLSDDPQLEKQIGCMTGLLQIFDRQQALLRGKRTTRRISSSGAKAPPTTVSPNNAAAASLNHSPGRGMKKTGDNTSSAGDMVALELGHRESSCGALEQSSSTSSGRLLRSSSSPSQAEFKEAADPKRGGSVDIKESLRLLAKLKEAPWNHNREVELPSRLQDAPRLSYDGVRSCFEFKDALRSSQRARDAPRLSLDGRRSNCATRMRPTSNVVARLMGLEELPDPCHTREEAKTSQLGRSTSNKERQSSGANKEDVAADAAAGRKVKRRSSSSSRYVMETMPRPPPSQDSSCSMHFNKALTKKRSLLVAKTNPGFSQDMEKQMMYLRLEESVEQRNILKDIVEVLHLKALLHWHGAQAKLNSTTTQTSIEQTKNHLVPSAKAECQANPASPRRDISHQNVRRLNTGDGVTTKVQGSRARQKNATPKKESCSGNRPNTRRASEAAVRATTQVQVHAKTTTKPVRYNVLGKSTSQRDESQVMMQECRGSMALAADAHDQQHSPASVLDTTTLVKFDDCRHPRAADQVEAYVKQILDAAGWLHGGHPLHCLNSTLFLALEKGMQDTTKVAVMHRRLIFDCVNHILARQMRQPCCFTNSWWHPQELVHQVVEELQQLESCARFEDVGEMLQDIVDKDVAAMSDGSSDQACELALHVERLLFKQLVDETIQDMTKLSSIRSMHVSTTRRQLFLL